MTNRKVTEAVESLMVESYAARTTNATEGYREWYKDYLAKIVQPIYDEVERLEQALDEQTHINKQLSKLVNGKVDAFEKKEPCKYCGLLVSGLDGHWCVNIKYEGDQ